MFLNFNKSLFLFLNYQIFLIFIFISKLLKKLFTKKKLFKENKFVVKFKTKILFYQNYFNKNLKGKKISKLAPKFISILSQSS